MIRRFFDLCDRNKDGLLSVAYFNNYVLGQPNMPEGFRYEQIDEEKVVCSFPYTYTLIPLKGNYHRSRFMIV